MRVLVFLLVCVACGGSPKPEPAPLSAKWNAPTMLGHVPADSPYLLALLEPMPEAARRQTFAGLDRKLATARARLAALSPAERAAMPTEDRLLTALFEELPDNNLEHWGRDLGLDPNGRFVLYGLSVWPVMRLAVVNETRVRDVLQRVIAKARVPMTQRSLKGHTYWQFENKNLAVVVGIGDGELVAAALPAPALAQYLPIVLGLEKPARSLHDSHRVTGLLRRYHFMAAWLGYVDAKIVVDILTGRAASANTELDRPMHTAMGPVSEACTTDLDRLAAFVPRLVFGYHSLDAKNIHATFVIEMPAQITEALQRLQAPMPGMTPGLGDRALMSMGLAAELDQLLPLLHQLTDHIRDQPFACDWFKSLNGAGAKLASLLDTPLPPALHGLHGLSFVVDDMTRDPSIPQGHALLVAEHAHDLLVMVMRLMPPLAGVNVYPDGNPVPLPLANLGAPAQLSAHVAARTERVSLALGPNSAKEAARALDQPAPSHSPLMSVAFDVRRMVDLGLMEEKDAAGMRDLAMQLDVGPEGLLFELYGTFAAE